jgi:hypothetical protein
LVRAVKLLMRTRVMTGIRELLARDSSDLWERLTVGGVVVILVAFLVLFVANLATTLCSAQLPR